MKLHKHITIILLSTVCLSALQGQIKKGSVLMGGDISNLDWKLGGDKQFSGTLTPKLAYFIHDNFALGSYITFHSMVAKGVKPSTLYGIGTLGRYYFNRQNSSMRKGKLFTEGSVGIEGYNPPLGDNTNGLGYGIGPGIAYFISSNIGLEALVKYKGIIGFGSAPVSHQLLISFGFQIYFLGTNG